MAVLSTPDLTICHLKMVSKTVDNMRRMVELTDTDIQVENCHYRAHRIVLCGASSYFRAMFNSGMQEATSGMVSVSNISASSFEVVLEYIYSGILRMNDDVETIKSVLSVAHLLQMEPLYSHCFDLLCCEEKLTHCFAELWQLMELYDDVARSARVFDFVRSNLIHLVSNPEFLQLTFEQVKRILQSRLSNLCTDSLVQGILCWVEGDLLAHSDLLLELLTSINLEHLSSEYISILQQHDLVANNKGILQLVLRVAAKQLKAATSQTIACFGREQQDSGLSYVSTYVHFNKTWHTKVLPFVLRKSMATAYFDNYIYFVGGGECYDDVLKYSLSTNTVQVVTSIPLGRKYAGAAKLRNKLFVVGGEGIHSKFVKRVDCYCSVLNKWEPMASTRKLHYLPLVVSLMDNLVVVGSKDIAAVELYKPETNQWTYLATLPSVDNSFQCSAAVTHNQLYWMSESNILYVYDYFSAEWTEVLISGEVTCDNGSQVEGKPFVLCAGETGNLCKFYPDERFKEPLCKPLDIGCWFRWQTVFVSKAL